MEDDASGGAHAYCMVPGFGVRLVIGKPARNFFDLYELVQARTSPKSGKSL
jgi:hypothetical protein